MNRASMKIVAAGVLLLLGATIPTCVESQPLVIDLSGTWDLSTTALIPGEGEPCHFVGSAEVMQKGSNLYGRAYLALESGPAPWHFGQTVRNEKNPWDCWTSPIPLQ